MGYGGIEQAVSRRETWADVHDFLCLSCTPESTELWLPRELSPLLLEDQRKLATLRLAYSFPQEL